MWTIVVMLATTSLPSYAQKKADKTYLNRFTAPIVNPSKMQQDPLRIQRAAKKSKAKKQKIVVYDNKYVKQICRKWPKCEEWAKFKHSLDSSFRITDAEPEFWFKEKDQTWVWRLYLQTTENDGKAHSYVFGSWGKEISYFPGHPFPNQSFERSEYVTRQMLPSSDQSKEAIAQRWPVTAECLLNRSSQAIEQQRFVWDKNGNPVGWKRKVTFVLSPDDERMEGVMSNHVTMQAQQREPGGEYIYSDAKDPENIYPPKIPSGK